MFQDGGHDVVHDLADLRLFTHELAFQGMTV